MLYSMKLERSKVSNIYKITDDYVQRYVELDPMSATYMGIPGGEDRLTDSSPEGVEERAGLTRSVLARLEVTDPCSAREKTCKETAVAELSASLSILEAGEYLRDLNVLFSPLQGYRQIFDLMPRTTKEDWEHIATRLESVPEAMAGYRRSLDQGIAMDVKASLRQTLACAKQAETWSEDTITSFFGGLAREYSQAEAPDAGLKRRIEKAGTFAASAYGLMAEYLRGTYAQAATQEDGVGEERYGLYSMAYNGIRMDLKEIYQWGWDELRKARHNIGQAAHRIVPGGSVAEAVNLLETDPTRSLRGVERFRQWLQDLQDRTVSELDGTHFDLAEPVKRIEVMIAPPGGALAPYYTGPSEDFSRPGRTWYPVEGREVFPTWREVSTAYHEGVPGHHFQIASTVAVGSELSRYQRLMAGCSGYVEGWALYAERLMGELGYLENPEYLLGMLDAQILRSVRVVIDIGMHLKLRIPDVEEFHPGETWNAKLGLDFMRQEVRAPEDFIASEIDRYLGIPGQAISYKTGERVWLEARESARKQLGGNFDLKSWHTKALNLGPMGLAQMKKELVAGNFN